MIESANVVYQDGNSTPWDQVIVKVQTLFKVVNSVVKGGLTKVVIGGECEGSLGWYINSTKSLLL